jgi:hypothetical protein
MDRLPPQDLDAEKAVLGSILMDATAISEVMDFLQPDDFYRQANGEIYRAMVALYERGVPSDVLTVQDQLNSQLESVGGSSYLSSLSNEAPTSVHVLHYGQVVARKAAMRRMILAAGRISAIAYEDGELQDSIDRSEAEFHALISDSVPRAKPDVEQVGLGFQMNVYGYRFAANRVTESRGEVWVHLSVDGPRNWLLRPVHVNLSSPTARKGLATNLGARAKGARVDWVDLVDRFCGGVINIRQQGEPIERVGRLEGESELQWLVEPFMPLNVPTILYGPQKIRKSTLGQIIAVGCQTGITTIPGWHFRQCNVAALDWEADREEWNWRIKRIASGLGIDPPEIFYRLCTRTLVDQVEDLAVLRAKFDIGLWIVDSANPAMRQTGDGGDPSGAAIEFFNAMRAIGGTWLIIDHVSGMNMEHGQSGPIHKPIGSTLKTARARAAWELKSETNPSETVAELLLRCEAMNGTRSPAPISLRIVYEPTSILVKRGEIEAIELIRTLPKQDQMQRYLWAGARTDHEIALELECPEATVRVIVHRFPQRFVRLHDKRIGLVSDATLHLVTGDE